MGLDCGQLFCNPIPWDFELDIETVEKAVRLVFKAARKKNKRNKEDIRTIIFNIRKFGSNQRGGAILAERALLLNNAKMGARIAIELSKLEGFVFPPLAPISYTLFPPLPISWVYLMHLPPTAALGKLKQPYNPSRPYQIYK